MVNALLLTVSILMNLAANSVLKNDFCKKEVKNNADLYAFNGLTSVMSVVTLTVLAVMMGSLTSVSLYTVLLGLVFGLVTALAAVFNMKALECGPMSYTSVIISCSLVIPSFSGALLFHETIAPIQYIGVVFMLISFLCAMDKRQDRAGVSLKWFLFCMISFVFNGAIGVMQKVHQSSAHREELAVFLLTAFLFSAVFSAVMIPVFRRREGRISVLEKGKGKKFLIVGAVCGVFIAFCNQINMYLSGVMPSVLFFPVVNGGCMILTAFVGVLFLRERFSVKQWIGLVVGTAAIFLLCAA
ncbi:MAG: EamA family transporter [Eubacteriales bacterium]